MKAIIAKEQASDLTPAAFTLSGGAIVGLLGDRFRFAYSQTGSYGAQFQPWIVVSCFELVAKAKAGGVAASTGLRATSYANDDGSPA